MPAFAIFIMCNYTNNVYDIIFVESNAYSRSDEIRITEKKRKEVNDYELPADNSAGFLRFLEAYNSNPLRRHGMENGENDEEIENLLRESWIFISDNVSEEEVEKVRSS
jgi:hypothetical protein